VLGLIVGVLIVLVVELLNKKLRTGRGRRRTSSSR